MNVVITKITSEMYIVNGKTMMLENLKWKPQVEELSNTEVIAFKQRLNTDLFNDKNINYATIGNIRYRRSNK